MTLEQGIIQRLEELEKRAVPGPWFLREPKPGDKDIFIESHPGSGERERLECIISRDDCDRDKAIASARLIHALRNAFPYLIAAAKEAEASRRALVQTGSGEHVTLAWGTNGRQADKDLIEARALTDAAKAQAEEQGNVNR